jgi:uncharacterized protein (DUF1330 family)
MAAYVILEVERITDPVRYGEYIAAAPSVIATYGGKYLARGGSTLFLEGDRAFARLVVLEFQTMARATEWWNSPQYQGPKALRQSASVSTLMLVEGVPPS